MESKQCESTSEKTDVQVNVNMPTENANITVKSAESEEPYDPGESIDETVLAGLVAPTNNKPEIKQLPVKLETSKIVMAESKMDARNKRLDRSRKKNEKNYELFLKSLHGMGLQDQTDVLIKKTNDMMEEIRTLTSTNKLFKTKVTILEKEKEQLQSEQNKNLIARSRLENICRELQRQNKQIKDETATKIREEEEKRKEVTTKFQSTLNDVSKMMEQNSNENIKLRDDNIQISDRFKKLCEEFKAREEDVQRISKQLGLEKKLSEANLARCQLELEAERCEKEVWLKEKETLLKKLHDATKEKLHLEITIKNMEEHLAKYSDKYQKFESTITKSNEIFEVYKVELATMSNQVSKLETDCLVWKDRWVQTSQSVNRLIGVNQSLEHDLKISDKKLDQLVGLCRFLQNERSCYLKQLKDNNIEPVPTSPADASSEKSSVDTSTEQTSKFLTSIKNPSVKTPDSTSSPRSHPLTAKERELQALRNEIVKLQSEINKAVEKEVEEKLKAKQQAEMESKGKRRAKGKKSKKNVKLEEKASKVISDNFSKKPLVLEKSDPVSPSTVPNEDGEDGSSSMLANEEHNPGNIQIPTNSSVQIDTKSEENINQNENINIVSEEKKDEYLPNSTSVSAAENSKPQINEVIEQLPNENNQKITNGDNYEVLQEKDETGVQEDNKPEIKETENEPVIETVLFKEENNKVGAEVGTENTDVGIKSVISDISSIDTPECAQNGALEVKTSET